MEKNLFLLFMLPLLISISLLAQEAANDDKKTGDLTVEITGFENDKGKVKITLVNSKENYSKKENHFRKASTGIENKKAVWVFENIPFGEYAVKSFHDENDNKKLDKSFIGIPKEKYGFSNNARGKFGPPDYKDAKFIFDSTTVSIELKVK